MRHVAVQITVFLACASAHVAVAEQPTHRMADVRMRSIPKPRHPQLTDSFMGARSCSATACHGSTSASSPQQPKDREFVFWLENDPHAKANERLHGRRSLFMLQRLGIWKDNRIVDGAGYKNCLACHNLTSHLDEKKQRAASNEGVSCEACHGPSRNWIDQHYTHPWTGDRGFVLSESQKSRLGFRITDDLQVRANVCVTCHVGAADREVNHDMIAAGHPPLKFELARYLDRLPKHWDDRSERMANRGLELELWQRGQTAAARAALELLATRAERAAAGQGVWPEFSEYDCFSCHHELTSPSWRQETTGRPLGRLRWGSWYFAMAAENLRGVDEVRALMTTNKRGFVPAAAAVAGACRTALASLPRFEPSEPKTDDWDSLAQSYLATVAAETSQLDAAPGLRRRSATHASILKLQNGVHAQLAFPLRYNSPRMAPPDQGTLDAPEDRAGRPQTIIRRDLAAIFQAFASESHQTTLMERARK